MAKYLNIYFCKTIFIIAKIIKLSSANIIKWSNTLKLPTNCLSVFDHFRVKYLGLNT